VGRSRVRVSLHRHWRRYKRDSSRIYHSKGCFGSGFLVTHGLAALVQLAFLDMGNGPDATVSRGRWVQEKAIGAWGGKSGVRSRYGWRRRSCVPLSVPQRRAVSNRSGSNSRSSDSASRLGFGRGFAWYFRFLPQWLLVRAGLGQPLGCSSRTPKASINSTTRLPFRPLSGVVPLRKVPPTEGHWT